MALGPSVRELGRNLPHHGSCILLPIIPTLQGFPRENRFIRWCIAPRQRKLFDTGYQKDAITT